MAAPLLRTAFACSVLFLGSAAALSQSASMPQDGWGSPPGPAANQGRPMITDTLAYCRRLAERMAVLQERGGPPHPEADLLARDGVQMCELGRVRQGVLRLRHALMRMAGAEPPR